MTRLGTIHDEMTQKGIAMRHIVMFLAGFILIVFWFGAQSIAEYVFGPLDTMGPDLRLNPFTLMSEDPEYCVGLIKLIGISLFSLLMGGGLLGWFDYTIERKGQ